MSNTVNLEFAGDASKLAKEAKRAESSVVDFGKGATTASDDLGKAGKASDDFTGKIGKLGAGVSGMSDAVDNAAGTVQALVDAQQAGAEKASRLARANLDVQQATEDMAQATRDAAQAQIDGRQAVVDEEQARLDQTVALRDYNTAVKEHGKNSVEARQAQIDLKQAGLDVQQAQEDAAQATRDASQANIDGKTAQQDLNDAMREAHPPELQGWADTLNMVSPLLSGLIGIMGLVTAAQWAWNAAQLASPTTWIVLAVVALIAIIVLLVKNWDWVKEKGAAAWSGIKKAASATWEFMKKIPGWIGSAFKGIAALITWPFRTAFNLVADAWNATIGKLHWTVPGWIPGIGGSTIAAPQLGKFHQGGKVPGMPGQEALAILSGGERVTSQAGQVGDGETRWVPIDLGDLGAALLPAIEKAVSRRGGSVTALGVRVRANGTVG